MEPQDEKASEARMSEEGGREQRSPPQLAGRERVQTGRSEGGRLSRAGPADGWHWSCGSGGGETRIDWEMAKIR